jgi:hypothetical protein
MTVRQVLFSSGVVGNEDEEFPRHANPTKGSHYLRTGFVFGLGRLLGL